MWQSRGASSSRRTNAAGGALDLSASGVAESELTRAISLGVTKVNIGTDGRLIWTRVHREFFKSSPKEFDFMAPGKIYTAKEVQLLRDKYVPMAKDIFAAAKAWTQGEEKLGFVKVEQPAKIFTPARQAQPQKVQPKPGPAPRGLGLLQQLHMRGLMHMLPAVNGKIAPGNKPRLLVR